LKYRKETVTDLSPTSTYSQLFIGWWRCRGRCEGQKGTSTSASLLSCLDGYLTDVHAYIQFPYSARVILLLQGLGSVGFKIQNFKLEAERKIF